MKTLSSLLFYTDTPNFGGAEKQMNLLAKHLKSRGFRISLAYGKYSKLREYREELESLYDEVFVLNTIHKHDPRHYFELRKIFFPCHSLVKGNLSLDSRLRLPTGQAGGNDISRFDLVHLHLWNPGACRYAFFAAASKKVPIVTTEHDPFELRGIKRLVKEACLRRTAHTIAISNAGYEDLRRWYNIQEEKISVVHNGISMSSSTKTEDLDSRLRGNDRGKCWNDIGVRGNGIEIEKNIMITCIAELHERKGHKYLLETFCKLQSKMPNLHLQLVGTGPLEKKMKSRYGKNPNIHFLGWRDDVPEILKSSDLFILPSLKEAFGLVILEAMANGVAVIGTDSGGVRDIIENGKSGLLVPPANSETLYEAIEKLLCDPEQKRALEEAALKRVHEFSAERMTEGTMKVYAKLQGDSSRSLP